MTQCIMKSGDFYKVAIMPESYGNFFTRSCMMTTIDGRDEVNYKYCCCKEELGGQMVHCYNDDDCP